MGLTQEFEAFYWNQNKLVLGLDEAGRGPMAGPCVVAGVVFPMNFDHEEINDSKKLTEKKRKTLAQIIYQEALFVEVEIITVDMIDEYNIYQATKMGMENIAQKLKTAVVLSDALPLNLKNQEFQSIVKGDTRSISIAAASIIAKTVRDEIMIELDKQYPEYGFKNHKGYGTKAHKEAILKHGRTKVHRKSFRFKQEDQISLDI